MSLIESVREWLEDRRVRKLLHATPAHSLGALPENTFGRVAGVARPLGQRVLEAPLSGRSCLYYSIALVELRPNNFLRRLATEQESVPFLLEDGTGRALIDPEHARFSCAFDHESESKAAFDASVRQRALLERHSLVRRNWFGTDAIRYREAVIAVDERITVLGAGTRELDPATPRGLEQGYREGGPTRMRFTGTAKYPLTLSDDPRSL